jgi:hypothetical protein
MLLAVGMGDGWYGDGWMGRAVELAEPHLRHSYLEGGRSGENKESNVSGTLRKESLHCLITFSHKRQVARFSPRQFV